MGKKLLFVNCAKNLLLDLITEEWKGLIIMKNVLILQSYSVGCHHKIAYIKK